MVIRDILNMKGSMVFSIAPQDKLADAVSQMVKHDVGSLVVMEGARMVGMVTFREVLKALDAQHGNVADLRVESVMVGDPLCGALDDTLDHSRSVMTESHVRYLPVKDGEKLAGVISFHDLAKAALRETSFENQLLKRAIKQWPEADEPIK